MRKKSKFIVALMMAVAMLFSMIPATSVQATEENYVVVGIQGNGGEFVVTDRTETWITGGCGRGVDPGQTLRDAGYVSVETPVHLEDKTREFLGWQLLKGDKEIESQKWTVVEEKIFTTEEMLDYVIPASDTEMIFEAQWSEGIGGGAPTYEVMIDLNGGTAEVQYEHMDEYDIMEYSTSRSVLPDEKVKDAMYIVDLKDPVYWTDREFIGWMLLMEERITVDGDSWIEWVQIEGTDIMSTEEMLNYVVPYHDIQIVAQWAGDDNDYYAELTFDAYNGTMIFEETYYDENEQPEIEEWVDSVLSFRLERRNDVTIAQQLKAQQNMRIKGDPVKEGADFEGWLKFSINRWTDDEGNNIAERVLSSEDLYSTEIIMNGPLPSEATEYVAKWSDISMDEYINEGSGGDSGIPEDTIIVNIDANDGKFKVYHEGSTEAEMYPHLGEWAEEGMIVRDLFGIDSMEDPEFWTEREFLGWLPCVEEYFEDEYDSWTEWVPIDETELLTTEEMLNYEIPGRSILFSAQWEGRYEDYYSDLEFNGHGGEFEVEYYYFDEDERVVEASFKTNGLSFPVKKTEDTVRSYCDSNGSIVSADPVKENGAEFEGWLKFNLDFVVIYGELCRTRTLDSEKLYSTQEVLADTISLEYDGVEYVAKWSDVPMDEYLESDGGEDFDPYVLEIEYWYYDENGEYLYYPVAIDLDGETTFGEYLAEVEAALPAHYEGMEFTGWNYEGMGELDMNAVATGGWLHAAAQYKEALVTTAISYFDADGEPIVEFKPIIIGKDKTYYDVCKAMGIQDEAVHCEEYAFTGEWRPNQPMMDTISADPFEWLILTAVYENMPVHFTYSYLENGEVKKESVDTFVNSEIPTLQLVEQNMPKGIDTTNIDSWELYPDYSFENWVSANYSDVWVAADYNDSNPVFAGVINLEYNAETKEQEIVETEQVYFVNADVPSNEEDPKIPALDAAVFDAAEKVNNSDSDTFKFENYEVHMRLIENADAVLANKGEVHHDGYELKHDYELGVKYLLKAVYDKSLVVLEYPDGKVERLELETGSTFVLPEMYNGQQLYWDQGIAFAGGNPVLGGEEVIVESPYTSFTSIYRLNTGGLTSVPEDLGMTVAEVKNNLAAAAKEELGNANVVTKFFDVSLSSKDYDDNWSEIDGSWFPMEGFTFTLPYPANTKFVVTHMITDDYHPTYKKGEIEILEHENTEDGIKVTVYSMSPIGVSYVGNEEPSEALAFSGASLTLHDNLTINYKVKKSLLDGVGYENPYVVFSVNGREVKVTDYKEDATTLTFDFVDIAPNQMNDMITATLYAEYNGTEYASTPRDYSVATYCNSMISKYNTDQYAELRTLLVDLMNYGAQSQIYTGYKLDDLVNASLTDEQKAWGTTENRAYKTVQEAAYEEIDNPTVAWRGAGLNLKDRVEIRMMIAADSIENLTVKVTSESGGEWEIPAEKFELAGDGRYNVSFNGLNAGQMSESVYFTVYDGDKAVSNTARYSVESYAYAQVNKAEDAKLIDIINAMMKYGDSAYNYAH